MALLNDFKLGADPEFVLYNNGHALIYRPKVEDHLAPWGVDHGGYVIEPHPKPDPSVRNLIQNLKASFNDFATVAPECNKWLSGAYMEVEERPITLGGHVHIDRPTYTPEQLTALDNLTKHLEALDILPKDQCKQRRDGRHYGAYGDVRAEHGHFEYRTMPSWLFSQWVTKLCLIGSKLLVIDPAASKETLGTPTTASVAKLKALFERFKGKDDDVDWVLDARMLDRKLNIKPDRDLRDVWGVTPEKEKPRWKEAEQKVKRYRPTVGGNPQVVGAHGNEPFYGMIAGYIYRCEGNLINIAILPPLEVIPAYDVLEVNNGVPIRWIARRDQPWPTGIGINVIETTRLGATYRWALHLDQERTVQVNNTLRLWVDGGLHQTNQGVQFYNGIAFEYLGQVGA